MRFCKVCDRAMARDASTGELVFRCLCGAEEPGEPADRRVAGGVLSASETTELYVNLIRDAAHDRVNAQVRRDCPDCGLDYATLIRLGEAEVIIYKCKCGRESRGAEEKQEA